MVEQKGTSSDSSEVLSWKDKVKLGKLIDRIKAASLNPNFTQGQTELAQIKADLVADSSLQGLADTSVEFQTAMHAAESTFAAQLAERARTSQAPEPQDNEPDKSTTQAKEETVKPLEDEGERLLQRGISLCTTFEGVAAFLEAHLKPAEQITSTDDKLIARFLQNSYPDVLRKLKIIGLDRTGSQYGKDWFWLSSSQIKHEKGRIPVLQDFDLTFLPDSLRPHIEKLLQLQVDNLRATELGSLQIGAEFDERSFFDVLSRDYDREKRIRTFLAGVVVTKEFRKKSPWLTDDEVDQAFQRVIDWYNLFVSMRGAIDEKIMQLTDEKLGSTFDQRQQLISTFFDVQASKVKDDLFKTALKKYIGSNLNEEYYRRARVAEEKREADAARLSKFDWATVVHYQEDRTGTRRDLPPQVTFGIDSKDAQLNFAWFKYDGSKLLAEKDAGFMVWCKGDWRKLDALLDSIIKESIVLHYPKKDGSVYLQERQIVANVSNGVIRDIHAFLAGVNSGYNPDFQVSEKDKNNPFLEKGVAVGASLPKAAQS